MISEVQKRKRNKRENSASEKRKMNCIVHDGWQAINSWSARIDCRLVWMGWQFFSQLLCFLLADCLTNWVMGICVCVRALREHSVEFSVQIVFFKLQLNLLILASQRRIFCNIYAGRIHHTRTHTFSHGSPHTYQIANIRQVNWACDERRAAKKTAPSKYRNVDKACVWASDEQEHGDYPSTALHGCGRLRCDDIRAMAKIVLKTLYSIHWPSLMTRILKETEFVGQIVRWMVKITIFTFTMILSVIVCVCQMCVGV